LPGISEGSPKQSKSSKKCSLFNVGIKEPRILPQCGDLAKTYRLAKDYPNSEAIYKKIIESKSLKPGSGEVLGSIEDLSAVYEEEGKFEEAEALYRKSIDTSQRIFATG
jgi:tetratricopeptide (TPR) repeat protein